MEQGYGYMIDAKQHNQKNWSKHRAILHTLHPDGFVFVAGYIHHKRFVEDHTLFLYGHLVSASWYFKVHAFSTVQFSHLFVVDEDVYIRLVAPFKWAVYCNCWHSCMGGVGVYVLVCEVFTRVIIVYCFFWDAKIQISSRIWISSWKRGFLTSGECFSSQISALLTSGGCFSSRISALRTSGGCFSSRISSLRASGGDFSLRISGTLRTE